MADSVVRDIGVNNQYSMKNGVLFHKKKHHFYGFLAMTHLITFDYYYRSTPRKFKIHRSAHQYLFFGASIYLPYRFDA